MISSFKKSQSSLEFLMIFAIGFGLIAIFSGVFFSYFSSEKASIDKLHLENVGNEIISNIEMIYFLGSQNRVTIDTKLPDGITNFTIHHINNFTTPLGEQVSYDFFNISYIRDGETFFELYETRDFYIRFNCSRCYHNYTTNISYYNASDFNTGFKRIRFESKGDYVNVDFVVN